MLDEKTYADALTRRADMLYHIAKTLLVSDDDCRDALQDAALRGWERRWQLRDAQLFDAWITRILINCCHAIGRKSGVMCCKRRSTWAAIPRPTVSFIMP